MIKRAAGRPAGRPPKDGGDALRDLIMEAAISLFAAKGLAGASLKEISRRSGVSPALIYYHFGNRENLIEETLNRFGTA
jgi:AcrR family transcriptional regulator